jgi:hypothetical protein
VESRKMRRVVHVSHMEEITNAYKSLVGKREGKSHSEDLGIDGRIILERISGKYCGEVWIGYI